MTICARDHERIAYRGTECPACRLVEEVAELKNQVDALNMELFDQDKRVSEN